VIKGGLIVNELVSNSLKHAFPDNWEGQGKISISLTSLKKKSVELVVKDNGVGIRDHFDIHETTTLGMKLVMILVEDQLHGSVQVENKDGARFGIQFQV